MPDRKLSEVLDELERLEKAATAGPWEWSDVDLDNQEPGELPYVPQGSTLGDTLIMLDDTYDQSREDCALLAALRNAAPQLLSAAREAERLRAATETAIAKFGAYFEYHSADHEGEDCPEDDTCECPLVVGVNEAFTALQEALAATEKETGK